MNKTAAVLLGCVALVMVGCDKAGEENPPPVSTSVPGAAPASAAVSPEAAAGPNTAVIPTHGDDATNGGHGPNDGHNHAAPPSAPSAAPPAEVTPPALPDGHPVIPPASAQAAPPPAAPPAATPSGDLVWKLPAGWTETGPTGMRAATLLPPGGGVECTVFKFGGAAGGLLSNVNRWRGQIGLEPLAETALSAELQERKPPGLGTTALTCDMTGPKGRVLGAIVVGAEGTWFFKIQSADGAKVEAVKQGFVQTIDSLSFQK